ncbi:MAG: hypothetical protein Q8K60_08070 [Parachlamydiaceae bacterium]|nr:hypothetical protein [Parachlamydiaceae bacterium]
MNTNIPTPNFFPCNTLLDEQTPTNIKNNNENILVHQKKISKNNRITSAANLKQISSAKTTKKSNSSQVKIGTKVQIIKRRPKRKLNQAWEKNTFDFMLNSVEANGKKKKKINNSSKKFTDQSNDFKIEIKKNEKNSITNNSSQKPTQNHVCFMQYMNNGAIDESIQTLNESSENNYHIESETKQKQLPILTQQTHMIHQNAIQELFNHFKNNSSQIQMNLKNYFTQQNMTCMNNQMYSNNNNSLGIENFTNFSYENSNSINKFDNNYLNQYSNNQQNLHDMYQHLNYNPNINNLEYSNSNECFNLNNYFNDSDPKP